MLKILHRANAHLIDLYKKKFNNCRIKGTGIYDLFGQALQEVFLAAVDLLYTKIS